jgi:hypothetical protein
MLFIIAITNTSYAHLNFPRPFLQLLTLALWQAPSAFSLPRNWLHLLREKTRNLTRIDVYELNAAVLLPYVYLWVLPAHVP